MSEYINNMTRRKETIKQILEQLNEGKSIEAVKEEFAGLLDDADAPSITEVEQMLIEEGTPVDEIQRLCDVHVAFFRETLDAQELPENQSGHPLHTLKMENEAMLKVLDLFTLHLTALKQTPASTNLNVCAADLAVLKEYELHFIRKENILFPHLEKYGFYGPSQVMWGIHNQIRSGWKELDAVFSSHKENTDSIDFGALERMVSTVGTAMREMVYKEEKILVPAALERLRQEDWSAIRAQEHEVGFCFIKPPQKPAAVSATKVEEPAVVPKRETRKKDGLIKLNTGALSAGQIDLLLRTLPVDVTFVDENDEVRFFSQTRERVFQRSPAIIGRKVQNCHPPQSIHVVQQIVDDFRSGKRDLAEFWLEMGGRFILIQYFALRDEQGNYKGVIEVSQDATHTRSLSGEKRLLGDG